MGMVILNFKDRSQKVTFDKCSPVHRSHGKDNDERIISNENRRITGNRLGFGCGFILVPDSTVHKTLMLISPAFFFRETQRSTDKLTNLKKYTGDEFVGVDLFLFPLLKTSSNQAKFGTTGRLSIVFDMSKGEFKGIINTLDSREKCVTLWDLSSTSTETIYSPSSILNLDSIPEEYWPETCYGHRIKTRTMWLYLEFAFKKWTSKLNGRNLNFPIVKQKFIRLWPMRTPETTFNASNDVLAIGYDERFRTYSLYISKIRDGVLTGLTVCLEFHPHVILHLQRIFGPATEA